MLVFNSNLKSVWVGFCELQFCFDAKQAKARLVHPIEPIFKLLLVVFFEFWVVVSIFIECAFQFCKILRCEWFVAIIGQVCEQFKQFKNFGFIVVFNDLKSWFWVNFGNYLLYVGSCFIGCESRWNGRKANEQRECEFFKQCKIPNEKMKLTNALSGMRKQVRDLAYDF